MPNMPLNLRRIGEAVVMDEENEKLIQIPNETEIKEAIWNLHPLKSLGLDGYPRFFIGNYGI